MSIWGLVLLSSLATAPSFLVRENTAAGDTCVNADRLAPGMTILRLHLVDEAELAYGVRHELMAEAARIWAGAVSVRWSGDPNEPAQDAIADVLSGTTGPEVADIYVTVAGELPAPHPVTQRRALAEILFINGVPTTHITAFPREAERLLDGVRWDSQGFTERPMRMRHRLLGRILGRAVAHELGHYVLKSRDHAKTGLMRATLRTDELIAPSDGFLPVIASRVAVCAEK